MMSFQKEIMASQIIAAAVRTENLCLKKNRVELLFGSLIALIMVPVSLVIAMVTFKDKWFAVKWIIFIIHATMSTFITAPLIFINLAKFGTISMWYANEAYQLFKGGEKLKVADEKGELYEFDEEKYEAWLRKAIAA